MKAKLHQVAKFWGGESKHQVRYADIDPRSLAPFTGSHPALIAPWLAAVDQGPFAPNPDHRLTAREKKHRLSMWVEKITGWDLSHKHYRLVA